MSETVWASQPLHKYTADYTFIFVDGIACGTFSEPNVEELLKMATPAPFGKGDQTVFDPTVRHALQIDGKRITLKREVDQVDYRRGIERKNRTEDVSPQDMKGWLSLHYLLPPILNVDMEVELYKLHLYPTGGHFDKHTDTQHADNHVISAVIQLGSAFTGGTLHLDDNGLDVTMLGEADKSVTASEKIRSVTAAWYTDLTHWVDTVTSGNRIVLQFDVNSNKSFREGPSLTPRRGDLRRRRLAVMMEKGNVMRMLMVMTLTRLLPYTMSTTSLSFKPILSPTTRRVSWPREVRWSMTFGNGSRTTPMRKWPFCCTIDIYFAPLRMRS